MLEQSILNHSSYQLQHLDINICGRESNLTGLRAQVKGWHGKQNLGSNEVDRFKKPC